MSSKPGDVVFAFGCTWVRRPSWTHDTRNRKDWWWKATEDDPHFVWATLNELRESDNFQWLIQNGDVVPNYDTAVREYETLIDALEDRLYKAYNQRFELEKRVKNLMDTVASDSKEMDRLREQIKELQWSKSHEELTWTMLARDEQDELD
jgi:hypothetical protein